MKNQRGSAMIMLFIAVALFGALAYAFMQGSRTSTSVLTNEQAKSYAQQILAFGGTLQAATKRMMLRGCKDTDLDFANTVYLNKAGPAPIQPEGSNASAPTNNSCDYFNIAGAGVTPYIAPEGALLPVAAATSIAGAVALMFRKFQDIGPSAKSEIAWQMVQVARQVCIELNNSLGVTNPNGEPPVVSVSAAGNVHIGTSTGEPTNVYVDTANAIVGKAAHCTLGPNSVYVFMQTLYPR